MYCIRLHLCSLTLKQNPRQMVGSGHRSPTPPVQGEDFVVRASKEVAADSELRPSCVPPVADPGRAFTPSV